jgi:hypothetical protein
VSKVTRNRISVKTRFALLYTAQPQDCQNEILACTSRRCLEVNQTRVMRGIPIAQATKSRSYIKLYKFDMLLHGTWRSITQNISWRGPWFILRHYAFCQLFQLERYKPSHNLFSSWRVGASQLVRLIMMGWDYVSELRPPTGLLFISCVICERGTLWLWWCRQEITPDLCTRALWQSHQQRHLGKVGGVDGGVRILPISI